MKRIKWNFEKIPMKRIRTKILFLYIMRTYFAYRVVSENFLLASYLHELSTGTWIIYVPKIASILLTVIIQQLKRKHYFSHILNFWKFKGGRYLSSEYTYIFFSLHPKYEMTKKQIFDTFANTMLTCTIHTY